MGSSFSRLPNPASMTSEEREAFRRSFIGNRDNVERKDVEGGGVAFLSTLAGKFYVTAFAGKAVKPAFNYYFSTEQRRDEYVAGWVAGLVAKAKARTERSDARKADRHGLLVGSILCSTWGYEQSNCDFYQVVALVGEKMVEIRAIAAEQVNDGEQYMTGKVKAIPNSFTGPVLRKRATSNGIRLTSFSWASAWDGRPKHISWYA